VPPQLPSAMPQLTLLLPGTSAATSAPNVAARTIPPPPHDANVVPQTASEARGASSPDPQTADATRRAQHDAETNTAGAQPPHGLPKRIELDPAVCTAKCFNGVYWHQQSQKFQARVRTGGPDRSVGCV
jgi:hypothetical protein